MQKIKATSRLRRLAWLAVIVGLAAAGPAARAQTGEDALRFSSRFPAFGPRMTGMGGAGIAGVADYSALVVNPAGLGYFKRSVFSGSMTSILTRDDGVYRVPGFSNGRDNDVSDTRLGHAAYVYRVPTRRGALTVAASFNQVNTFERDLVFSGENPNNSITDFFMPLPGEFTLEEDDQGVFPSFTRDLSFIAFETFAIDLDPDLVDAGDPVPFVPAVTTGTVAQTGSVTEEGSMKEINFGGAVEASRGVMVGLSVNVPFGTYRFIRIFEEEDLFNDNDGSAGTTDFDFLRLEERVRSKLLGVNVRGGVSAVVAPQIRVGFTVESPTYYSVDEDFDTRLETFFDNGDVFVYGDQPEEDAGSGIFEYTVTTPWRIGAGLALRNAGFTLSADAEYVDWSQLELDASGGTFVDENRRIRQDFEAVVNTRIGVEYRLGVLALRGGFAYQPDPNGANEIDRSKTFYSAGLGYRFSRQFGVDFGWMQERFDDRYRPYVEVTDAPVVDEQVIRNRFMLGFKAFF